jgi:hypothetical protein
MNQVDERIARLVQRADQERQDRVKAEQRARALHAQNTLLRRQLATVAQDKLSTPKCPCHKKRCGVI